MKAIFIKTLGGLRPVDDCKAYNLLKVGEQTELDIKTPRNIRFHNKFFALINLAFVNQELYVKQDDLREDLIIAAGFYTTRKNHISEAVKLVADSISFAKMDDIEFGEVYNRVLDQVWSMLGGEKQDIIDELLRF